MKLGQTLGLSIALLCPLVQSCKPSVKVASGLRFIPAEISADGLLPGTTRHTATVVNDSQSVYRGLVFSRSCACLRLADEQARAFVLAPGQKQELAFDLTVSEIKPINQHVFVLDSASNIVAMLPVRGTPVNPIESRVAVNMHRVLSGSAASASLKLSLKRGVSVSNISFGVSWLQGTFVQSGNVVSVRLIANSQAADGTHIVPIALSYRSKGRQGTVEESATVTLRSDLATDAQQIWLGQIKPGETVIRTVCITGARASQRVIAHADGSRAVITQTTEGPDKVIVRVIFRSSSAGYFRELVTLRDKDAAQDLGSIPVCGFVGEAPSPP